MNPNCQPARLLWIEMATRVSTGSIHFRSGTEEAAAESIATLFPTIRDLLKQHPDADAFRSLAWNLLENILRPYTNRWHGWLVEDTLAVGREGADGRRFREERLRRIFRQELRELQAELNPVLEALATMAGIRNEAQARRTEHAQLGQDLVMGIRPAQVEILQNEKPGGPLVSVDEINQAESATLHRRRATLGTLDPLDQPPVLDPKGKPTKAAVIHNATGLALSGGGIRSATFSLGVAQVLARRKLLIQFDFLSSVSGGGYLASFLSCALGTRVEKTPVSQTLKEAERKLEDAFERQDSTESGLVRHLRNHSKFLLHGGLLGRLRIVGLMLSGLGWNLMIMLPVPIAAAVVAAFCGPFLWENPFARGELLPSLSESPAGFALRWTAAALAIAWVAIPGFQHAAHGQPPKSFRSVTCALWENLCLFLSLATAGTLAVYLLPALLTGFEWLRTTPLRELAERLGLGSAKAGHTQLQDALPATVAGVSSATLGALSGWIAPHWPRLRMWAIRLFILSGPLFLLTVFLTVANHLGLGRADPAPWSMQWVLGTTAFLLIWEWGLVNINTFAPHRYYRNRICECYLARRPAEASDKKDWLMHQLTGEKRQGRTEVLQQVKLSDLGADPTAPYHFVNMTINAPTSDNKNLRGRGGDFFVASRHFYGSPITGYARTQELEKGDPHFDLGTAMAVSAGAAGGTMGWKTMPHFRFIMTLFNVRLGYWLRHPKRTARGKLWEGAGPWYLLRELLGWINERSRYVNLSDGGHIENLAVYELLRRRCKFIVCVDGGCEPGMECADLTRLQRYAEIDLGLRMSFDLSDLIIGANGHSRAHAILVKLDYGSGSAAEPALGWMVYLKLSMTGFEPAYIKDYRRDNPDFPHQSTADQLFEEEQFEAYRALGECAMESLFANELTQCQNPTTLKAWFQCLADNLLPDNDPVFQQGKAAPHQTTCGV